MFTNVRIIISTLFIAALVSVYFFNRSVELPVNTVTINTNSSSQLNGSANIDNQSTSSAKDEVSRKAINVETILNIENINNLTDREELYKTAKEYFDEVTIVDNGKMNRNYLVPDEDTPSIIEAITPSEEPLLTSNDYSFPEIQDLGDGKFFVTGNTEVLPGASRYKKVNNSPEGQRISVGDTVAIEYSMYSWKSGEKVESSQEALGKPLSLTIGKENVIKVPDFLHNTIMGSQVGERYQIVFEAGMKDLPEYLDPSDAYVLVVDILDKESVGGF